MNNQKKNWKRNSGITLIALIVTIIVLIILATISINVVIGENGIIKKAQQTKKLYEKSAEDEEISLDNLLKQMKWDSDIVYGKQDADGYLIPIPNGYYYVEGTQNTGFVISDSQTDENNPDSAKGNQFVWVPVDDVNEYKLISWNGETVGEEETADTYYSDTNMAKPMSKNNFEDSTVIKTALENISYDLGTAFSWEKSSVEVYGGFYIGRYEVSYDSENNVVETKKNKTPYTNISYSNIVTIKQKAISRLSYNAKSNIKVEKLGLNQGITENNINVDTKIRGMSLVTGKQWDAMTKWLNKTNENNYQKIGHQGSNTINTGSNEAYKVNNIYDIAGNVS